MTLRPHNLAAKLRRIRFELDMITSDIDAAIARGNKTVLTDYLKAGTECASANINTALEHYSTAKAIRS